jgi:hypothetical protein
MNTTLKGAAGLPSVCCRPRRAYRHAVIATLHELWKQTAVLLFVAAALLLTGCATPFQGIYPDDSAFVSGGFVEYTHNLDCGQEDEWSCQLFIEEQSTGYLRNYRVESEFGVFSAEGGAMLNYRLDEIDAIAELDDFSVLDIFVDTFTARALRPVKQVAGLALHPIDTAKRLPGGYARTFQEPLYELMDDAEDVQKKYKKARKINKKVRKISKRISERAAEEAQESANNGNGAQASLQLSQTDGALKAEKKVEKPSKPSKTERLYARADEEVREELMDYFDLTDREKRWMHQVGVDPDSKNPVLFGQVRRLAWTERLVSYGTTFVTFPVLPGAAWTADIMSLAWSKPDHDISELFQLNDTDDAADTTAVAQPVTVNYSKKLKKKKVYLRSVRKRLVTALKALDDVPGIDAAFDAAMKVNSKGAARFYTASVEMAAWYQNEHHNVIGVVPLGPAVMVQFNNAYSALLLPGGITDWTPKFAGAAHALNAGRPELWFRENLSAAHFLQLSYDGWFARDDWQGVTETSTNPELTAKSDVLDLLTKTNRP